MAAPAPKAPPTEPVLENFYTVSQAAVRLNLRPEDEDSKVGEKWLRDGANRPEDGSKGPRFPARRMAGQLRFSDSDLAWIAEHCLNQPHQRTGRPSNNRRRPTRRKSAA